MIASASTYQLFARENKRVGLLMAGLPHQVSMLLRDEFVSFARRSAQHRLSGTRGRGVVAFEMPHVREFLAEKLADL